MDAEDRVGLLLALADDELIIGHRLSEWTGWVPYIEEDLALSSIAQDEMAHARVLYDIVTTLDGRDVDALALGREPHEYRNAILCERPNRDFAYTLARHWLYDTADDVRLRALADSSFKELREAVVVFLLEERFHVEHARAWFARLAGGPVDARHRFADALTSAFPEALVLFDGMPGEDEMRAEWLANVRAELEAVGLEQVLGAHVDAMPGEMIPTSSGEIAPGEEPARASGGDGAGGRRGEHSQDFLTMWQEMTALYRAHPGARW